MSLLSQVSGGGGGGGSGGLGLNQLGYSKQGYFCPMNILTLQMMRMGRC